MTITIRPISMDDLDAMKEIFSSEAVFAHFDHGPWTDEKVEASVIKNVQRWESGSIGSLVICQYATVVGRLAVYANEQGEHELGYVLNPKYWGLGIAKKAAVLAIDFVRSSTAASVLFAYARSTNSASIKILLSLGFKEISKATGSDGILRIKFLRNLTG